MVRFKLKIGGVEVDFEAESSIKSLVTDTVAAIEYANNREAVGPYRGGDKGDTKGETQQEVSAVESDEEAGKQKAAAVAAAEKKAQAKADREAKAKADKEAKAKAEAEAKAAAEKEAAESEPEAIEGEVVDPGEDVTLDDVRGALMALSKAKGAVMAKQVLTGLGFAKVSEVPEDSLGIVFAAINKAA